MVKMEFVLPWIQKAENDFSSALYLADNMHPPPVEIICFHCQQAVEKYLKAFLVYNDQEPPKTHDLIELAKQSSCFNKDFLLFIPKCEFLVPFAVRARYPSVNDPNDADMKTALTCAQEIIKLVKFLLHV